MNFDFSVFAADPLTFVSNEFLPSLFSLDPAAIAITFAVLILGFALLILLVYFFAWLLSLIKRFILFFIVLVSLVMFFFRFQAEILSQPPNYFILGVGAIGVVFALNTFLISALSLRKHWSKAKHLNIEDIKKQMKKVIEEEIDTGLKKEAKPAITPTKLQQPGMLTTQALQAKNIFASFHDRSVLAVLSYMVVAQFGVFSGITVSAPNETVGIIFFGLFMVAAIIFIKSTYHKYKTGLKHLAIALPIGVVLSIILGNVWATIPIETLLSTAYFSTNSLVALITGLAISLFMGSKG